MSNKSLRLTDALTKCVASNQHQEDIISRNLIRVSKSRLEFQSVKVGLLQTDRNGQGHTRKQMSDKKRQSVQGAATDAS